MAPQRSPSLTEEPAQLSREAGLELDSVEREPDALDDAGMIDYTSCSGRPRALRESDARIRTASAS